SKKMSIALARMMAIDYQPFSMVEDRGFRKFVATAEPRFQMPARTTISRDVMPTLYTDTMNDVKNKLKYEFLQESCTTSVSLTTDMWTSRAGDPFMAVT